MGDLSNMNDLERFLRSPEGQAHLEEIRAMLKGRTITDVTFSNEVNFIETTLSLDDGETFVLFQPSLEVDALRGAPGVFSARYAGENAGDEEKANAISQQHVTPTRCNYCAGTPGAAARFRAFITCQIIALGEAVGRQP